MDSLTFMRVVNFAAWLCVMAYMAPAAWSAGFGKNVRRGDPMRLGCFATAFVMALGYARWLFMPESIVFWQIIHIMTAVVAGYILILARSYGRGSRVE